ncbi:MAG: MCE family protein [Acetobacter sp.]|nr:MCE family protein [Acetobacter sp.]MBR2124449.1 MCE family protein [Acetobacter sp.]
MSQTTSQTSHRKTLLGVFVILGGLLIIFIITMFGHIQFFAPTHKAVVIFQDSINGLSVGAPVNFRGVKVGTVDHISLCFDALTHNAYIAVTLILNPSQIRIIKGPHEKAAITLKSLIANGLRAELNIESFVTGQSDIELNFNKSVPSVLHPNITDLPEIPVQLSPVQKLKNSLAQIPIKAISQHADTALLSVTNLSNDLQKQLPPLISSVKKLADRSTTTMQTATKTIQSLKSQLTVTLGKINTLIDTGNLQLDARGKDLHKTLTAATKTLDTLHSLLSPRSIDRANLDSALRDIAATASALRGFSNDIEHNPQLLLMGRRQ